MRLGPLGGLVIALVAAPATAQQACSERHVEQAFILGFPIYQMVRTRHEAAARVAAAGGSVVNAFNHRRTPSDHSHRNVTTPNNDTLYSAAWLDLAQGPVRIDLPPASGRYVSLALMDLFTDHFALLHPGRDGIGRSVLVVGPRWRGRGPRGVQVVRATMTDVWAIARVRVSGPADLAAAQAVQSRFAVATAALARPFREAPEGVDNPERFLTVVNEALERGPVPPAHARQIAAVACAGLGAGGWARLPETTRRIWRNGFRTYYDRLRGGLQRSGESVNGWSWPAPGIGEARLDALNRARVALEGLGALPAREAIYLSSRSDAAGRPLDGGSAYRLRIPAQIPADGFWSLSIYEIAADGRLFFAANPIGRYSIGDGGADLRRNPDGSVTIVIARRGPPEPNANWLPAPLGRFALTFRAYRPRGAMTSARFQLPAPRITASP